MTLVVRDCTPRFAIAAWPMISHGDRRRLVAMFGGEAAVAIAAWFHPWREP